MSTFDPAQLSSAALKEFFLRSAKPRGEWMVGMELEKLGREPRYGRPIPFDAEGPSVRKVLEYIWARRGGDPVYEAEHLIGLDGPWGSISLEPGGQVEWSSRPRATLDLLRRDLAEHLEILREAGRTVGVEWLTAGVDPALPVEEMQWMPKARYSIMRPYMGERGRLAHRMMTQTASIQVAFDYADPEDWRRKFKAAALATPVAVALFANSSRIDGGESGFRSYRQEIWRNTDPDRCGLPAVLFERDFSLDSWLGYALDVPTMFRHRARGLVPTGGVPFRELLAQTGCEAVKPEDWETHLSSLFTEVRSYGYIEVRSADLQPDDRSFAVPTLWTGLLYHEGALDETIALGAGLQSHAEWSAALDSAARSGLDGTAAGRSLRDLARELLSVSRRALLDGAACAGDVDAAARTLEQLAEAHGLTLG